MKTKFFFLCVTLCFLLPTEVSFAQEDCDPITTFPWHEGFEDNDTILPSCWTHKIWGNDPDWVWTVAPYSTGIPNTAQEGNYKVRSYYNDSSVHLNSSMLITPVLDLSALNKPMLVYWHTQKDKGSLRVYYRNNTTEEWKTYLQTFTSGNILDWQGEVVLLPDKSAHYQIGFESVFTGSGTAEIQLDNIRVMEFDNFVDVEVVKIITPNSGHNLTNNEPVKVLLKNNGSDPLTELTLKLELDGALITTETLTGSIPSLEQVEHIFATTVNLFAEGTYQIKVTAIAENDYISSNNSKTINVTNIFCPKITSFPWHEGFEDNGANIPKCWTLVGSSDGDHYWYIVPDTIGTPPTAHDGSFKARILL